MPALSQSRTKAGAKANSQPERAQKSGGQTHSGNSKHATKRREGKDTYLPIIMGKPSPNPPPKPPPYGKAMATAQNKVTSQMLLQSISPVSTPVKKKMENGGAHHFCVRMGVWFGCGGRLLGIWVSTWGRGFRCGASVVYFSFKNAVRTV
jgi:hypothetical protein